MEESSSLLRGYVNILSPSLLKPNISVYILFLWNIDVISVKYALYVYRSLSVYYIFMVRLAVYI